nr:hypothetical protein BSM_06410 [uncultured archaeon]
MRDKVFLDTNILVYLANDDSPFHLRIVKKKTHNIKGKKIHDTNIVAIMMANSIQTLFTLNTDDFKKFAKIQLVLFV